jgi:hypothetical protein
MSIMAFKATDYLITPHDVWLLVLALFRMSLRDTFKLLLVLCVGFVAEHYGVGFVDILFIIFLVGVFIYDISARVPISLALGLLILIVLVMLVGPHTEFVNETTWPEPIAVWVYYSLAIGVLKQMKDAHSEGWEDVDVSEVQRDPETPLAVHVPTTLVRGSLATAPRSSNVMLKQKERRKEPRIPRGLVPIAHAKVSPKRSAVRKSASPAVAPLRGVVIIRKKNSAPRKSIST